MKRPNSRGWFAVVATIIFVVADNLPYLMRFLDLRRFVPSLVVLGFRNILEIVLCFFGVSFAHRFGFKRSARELGLSAPVNWIFLRRQDNLQAIFGLHSLMNLWWEVFAVDDTALGGWLANVARLLTIALAIVLTIYKDRIWKLLPVEAENLLVPNGKEEATGENINRLSFAKPALT